MSSHPQRKGKGKGRKDLGTFRKDKNALLKRLLNDVELTDAVAIIGPDAQRIPIHKALLANVSEPFKKALYGTFREGQTQELLLPDIDLAAWRPIQRIASGLSPQLSSQNVVAALRGAEMYMIKELADECHRYISHEVQADGVLDVLTACILLGVKLAEETEHALWCVILANCKEVLESNAFISAHSMLIERLLQLDEFGVKEEDIWLRLLEWTRNLKDNVHLVGSLLDSIDSFENESPTCKRRKTESDAVSDTGGVQARCLLALSIRVRFPVMDETFFADNVMKFLQPEKANSVLLFYVLGRPSEFVDKKRKEIAAPQPEPLYVVIASHLNGRCGLLEDGAHWVVSRIDWLAPGWQPFLSAFIQKERIVTEIQLTAISWSPVKTIIVSKEGGKVHRTTVNPAHGQTVTIQPQRVFSSTCKWTIAFEKGQDVGNFELTRIRFIGHMSKRASIAAVLRQKAADLLVTSDRQ